MAYIVGVLLAIVVLLILALYRQQVSHLNHLVLMQTKEERERKEARVERNALLDRIQHPTVRQVEARPVDPPPIPVDAAELAQIGQQVPEFVHVGTPRDDPAWDYIGMEVPDDVNVVGENT